MNKKLIILIVIAVMLFGGVFLLQNQNIGSVFVWKLSEGGKWLLPLVVISSLIDSINPCAFSVLLLTIAFLFSLGKMRDSILKIGASYIFGLFVTYILIGLGILQALHFFDTPHFMAKVGAALLIALGLVSLINRFFPAFPIKLRIPRAAHKTMASLMEKASMPTAFALGGLVALCEFPCTGGPYLMILGLLHDQASYFKGFGYLILYNLIFVLPLAVVLAIASNKTLLVKAEGWKKERIGQTHLYGGIAMIILGIIIFSL